MRQPLKSIGQCFGMEQQSNHRRRCHAINPRNVFAGTSVMVDIFVLLESSAMNIFKETLMTIADEKFTSLLDDLNQRPL